jgi:hypothetical protein
MTHRPGPARNATVSAMSSQTGARTSCVSTCDAGCAQFHDLRFRLFIVVATTMDNRHFGSRAARTAPSDVQTYGPNGEGSVTLRPNPGGGTDVIITPTKFGSLADVAANLQFSHTTQVGRNAWTLPDGWSHK